MNARARVRGVHRADHSDGSGEREATNGKIARNGDCTAVSDGVPRVEDHAGTGYFTDSGVRREPADRNDVRRPDSYAGAAREGFAEIGGARSDEQADAESAEDGAGGADHLHFEPRKSGDFCGDGRFEV